MACCVGSHCFECSFLACNAAWAFPRCIYVGPQEFGHPGSAKAERPTSPDPSQNFETQKQTVVRWARSCPQNCVKSFGLWSDPMCYAISKPPAGSTRSCHPLQYIQQHQPWEKILESMSSFDHQTGNPSNPQNHQK